MGVGKELEADDDVTKMDGKELEEPCADKKSDGSVPDCEAAPDATEEDKEEEEEPWLRNRA